MAAGEALMVEVKNPIAAFGLLLHWRRNPHPGLSEVD
jgi:hypothetical protein